MPRVSAGQLVTSPVSGNRYRIGRKLGEGGFGQAYTDFSTDSWAVFADVDWYFTERWSLNFGAYGLKAQAPSKRPAVFPQMRVMMKMTKQRLWRGKKRKKSSAKPLCERPLLIRRP